MKEKRNELWKLDLLEAKYTQATPRFSFTKKLINARNNSHLMKKLPGTPNEAFQQIHALKADLFRKKYHGSYKKLSRDASRATKQKQKTLGSKEKHLSKLLQSAEFHEQLITAKLVKIVLSAILTTKETRLNPPSFIPEEIREYISDKALARNPSRFFITYCQNDKVVNEYISKLWNLKEMKTLCLEIDWSFRKIRGNLTKNEIASHSKETGKKVKNVIANEDSAEISESEESDSESGGSDSEDAQIDAEEAFEKFSAFDNMVAGSDEEQDFVADPNVDYNEITDQEMSESDNEREEERKPKESKAKAEKAKKLALPELATGYFSGGSDDEDDVDNDKVVKEATTVRKNRRGQRARQKIWEQKYGTKAVHVQKENLRLASERERKQQEFEERQRRREQKAILAQQTNTSKTAGSALASGLGDSLKVHPSWEAKRIAEEKMKNVKFEGKKITFD
ncbi:Bud-site selection protein [Metschnikowia bicuspidata var. bicuspidata NRRL YB-4993]|uniref:Bud-site selection protein n=1 Tax=Metschnikowia bicuspidata var. bicuspidata NRRL YB-4993 TaxID=869754 RepID=A0A1A0H8P2_9ASCO|nr:Bud-site selection protein [Metschnikowia bicuspidata var. bicuspidata NRRL YB-4993]OBA20253.1 Bud-site selection protein [Metschnikowia bicuspidata var. bicuspidata NRRL YB-4993]